MILKNRVFGTASTFIATLFLMVFATHSVMADGFDPKINYHGHNLFCSLFGAGTGSVIGGFAGDAALDGRWNYVQLTDAEKRAHPGKSWKAVQLEYMGKDTPYEYLSNEGHEKALLYYEKAPSCTSRGYKFAKAGKTLGFIAGGAALSIGLCEGAEMMDKAESSERAKSMHESPLSNKPTSKVEASSPQ